MEQVLVALAVAVVNERHELGMVGMMLDVGVNFEFAEASREGDMLCGRDVLVAKHEHSMARQELAKAFDLGRTEVASQRDVGQFQSQRRREQPARPAPERPLCLLRRQLAARRLQRRGHRRSLVLEFTGQHPFLH